MKFPAVPERLKPFAANRWLRRAAWVLAGWLLLCALGWLALPPLTKHFAQKAASEQLGRTVSIGAIDFKPWTLELTLTDLVIAGADGAPDQLRVQRIYLDAELQSLLRLAPVIDAVVVDAPQARLTHLGDGRYDIDDILARLATPPEASTEAPDKPARFALYNLSLSGGSFDFDDRAVGKQQQLRGLRIGVPFISNLPSQREVTVTPELAFELNGAPFGGRAQTTPFTDSRKTDATLQLQGLDLAAYRAYLPASLPLRLLSGRLDLDLRLAFEQAGDATLRLTGSVAARQLKLTDARGGELLAFEALDLVLDDVQPLQRSARIARVALAQPSARLERGADGRWAFEGSGADTVAAAKPGRAAPALASAASAPAHRAASAAALASVAPVAPVASVASAAPAAAVASAAASTAAASTAPKPAGWSLAVQDIAIDGGALRYADASVGPPVALELYELRAGLKNLALGDAARPTDAPLPVELSARVKSGHTESGALDWRGTLTLAPLAAQGELLLERLPLHQIAPYATQGLPLDLRRADAGFKGQLQFAQTPAGAQLRLGGNLNVDDLRARSIASADGKVVSEPLLNWKTLNLRGLEVALQPGQPLRVGVRQTTLADFFARIIISPQGRINLQDLGQPAPPQADAAATPAAGAASGVASAQAAPSATSAPASATLATSATPATSPDGAPPLARAPPDPDAPVIDIGPISFVKGRVLFSDRFIKPNYTANLTELTGQLSAFSSRAPAAGAPPALADLELRGKAEGSATLEISGKLNPLADPLALDIRGKVSNLELAPLSPYSIKYAGHGIERGKLSMDVNYKVLPDGQLTASNNLVLNQLTFGDEVAGATQSLPVKLAVALLADRNGVIDLNLPISGSLNDPQFSLGSVIFKVIVNLIVKAVTAPFSLLANAFGGLGAGGDDLGVIGFAPGSAALASDAVPTLDKIAKALAERPRLQLTVVGHSDLEIERSGYQRERMLRAVQSEKRRRAIAAGAKADAVPPFTPAEYPALLTAVYQRADFPKPRNLIGFAKDLPVPEMEALLMANVRAGPDEMRELALQRGAAVRDHLAATGLPPERLFVGAPRTVAAGDKWTPRAELNITMP